MRTPPQLTYLLVKILRLPVSFEPTLRHPSGAPVLDVSVRYRRARGSLRLPKFAFRSGSRPSDANR
jgi:hypothetical protein